MSVTITKTPRGKSKDRRLYRGDLQHNPSGHGKGKWQNKCTLWRFKLKARRLRKISANSRRINRQHA